MLLVKEERGDRRKRVLLGTSIVELVEVRGFFDKTRAGMDRW
jgi:hypothetical protein